MKPFLHRFSRFQTVVSLIFNDLHRNLYRPESAASRRLHHQKLTHS